MEKYLNRSIKIALISATLGSPIIASAQAQSSYVSPVDLSATPYEDSSALNGLIDWSEQAFAGNLEGLGFNWVTTLLGVNPPGGNTEIMSSLSHIQNTLNSINNTVNQNNAYLGELTSDFENFSVNQYRTNLDNALSQVDSQYENINDIWENNFPDYTSENEFYSDNLSVYAKTKFSSQSWQNGYSTSETYQWLNKTLNSLDNLTSTISGDTASSIKNNSSGFLNNLSQTSDANIIMALNGYTIDYYRNLTKITVALQKAYIILALGIELYYQNNSDYQNVKIKLSNVTFGSNASDTIDSLNLWFNKTYYNPIINAYTNNMAAPIAAGSFLKNKFKLSMNNSTNAKCELSSLTANANNTKQYLLKGYCKASPVTGSFTKNCKTYNTGTAMVGGIVKAYCTTSGIPSGSSPLYSLNYFLSCQENSTVSFTTDASDHGQLVCDNPIPKTSDIPVTTTQLYIPAYDNTSLIYTGIKYDYTNNYSAFIPTSWNASELVNALSYSFAQTGSSNQEYLNTPFDYYMSPPYSIKFSAMEYFTDDINSNGGNATIHLGYNGRLRLDHAFDNSTRSYNFVNKNYTITPQGHTMVQYIHVTGEGTYDDSSVNYTGSTHIASTCLKGDVCTQSHGIILWHTPDKEVVSHIIQPGANAVYSASTAK